MQPSITIGAVQPALRDSDTSPQLATHQAIQLIRQTVMKQHENGHRKIDLFVLPEMSPIGYSEGTFQKYLPTDGTFADDGSIDTSNKECVGVKCSLDVDASKSNNAESILKEIEEKFSDLAKV